ncbi:serine/threonine-protein kinase [Streptosporangium sp. NPDC023615]|uniref:serine/threonine-protein kinase n=1 Tax=Streptosporangium sp. NPDC023615 TaxID=3154794 RepID=UPI0034376A53
MSQPLKPGDPQRLDGYWLAGRLGAGGQGVVYDAYHDGGTRVAVKVLHTTHDTHLDRMTKEVHAARRIASFCTARILDARLEGPRPYIVSEFIDGPSLEQAVKQGRRFGGDELHRLAIGIATALAAIHRAGVVHRDLKPDNVLLGPDGPRLIDFGIARTAEMSLTPTGPPIGTPRYMAPEVFHGKRADAAADVFAWGAIIVFAATGTPAFPGESVPSIYYQVLNHEPDLNALPSSLRPLVGAALAKDPASRPASTALLAALVGGPAAFGDLMAAASAQAELLGRGEPTDPALGTVAEDVYARLTPQERDVVPEVFLRLVALTDGGDLSPRTASLEEVLDRGSAEEERAVRRALEAFDPIVDCVDGRVVLARPAALGAWPRLRAWVREAHDGLVVHQRIRQTARAWAENGRRPSDGLDGRQLQEALVWAAAGHRHLRLNRLERELLDAGTVAQARAARRRQIFTGVLAVLLVVSMTATGLAVRAQRNADEQRDLALSRQLAAQSELATGDPRLSALLAVAAWRVEQTPEARLAMLNVLGRPDRAVLTGHAGYVESVAFSPDGHTLATAGLDGTVRLWDVRTREPIGTPLTGHISGVSSVAFSPDGRTLATAGSDSTVRLWDVRTREPIGTPLTGHAGYIESVAFSPDGHTLATASKDDTVRLWDTRTREPVASPLAGHTDDVNSVAFSPDGHTLATAGSDDTLRLWDTQTREPIGSPLTGHTDDVESVTFSPDGHTLATAGSDDTLRLWDTQTREPIGSPLTGHTGFVSSVAFSPDGHTLATASWDNTVRLWDARTHKPIGTPLTGHISGVSSVAFSPDGHTLATAGSDSTVRLWDTRTRKPIGSPLAGHTDYVESVTFSPDGHTLATAGNDDTVRLWNVRTREPIGSPLAGHTSGVKSVAFGPDGHTLATASRDNTARLWDVRTREPIGSPLTGHTGFVFSVAFSPDGRTLATASRDNTVRLWDVRTHKPIGNPLTGHTDGIDSVAFSPDGHTLATAGIDSTVRLWDVRTRKPIGTPLTGHTRFVSSVTFSPDGHTLATAGSDNTVRLWDVRTHKPIGNPLTGHTDYVESATFSPDGRTLATASMDSTVRLWDVGFPADPPGAVCAVAGGFMTAEEWESDAPEVAVQKVCH